MSSTGQPLVGTMSTSSGGPVQIIEMKKPEPLVLPKFGEWPQFWAPRWVRNGREAGAYLAGVVGLIPEKCAHVVIKDDHVAGAMHAMVEGDLQVKSYSSRPEDGEQTFEVRSIHWDFVEDAA